MRVEVDADDVGRSDDVGCGAGDDPGSASDIEDLLGLSRNPRMLSFVADLDPEQLRAVATASSTLSAADLYRQILRASPAAPSTDAWPLRPRRAGRPDARVFVLA